MPPTLELLPTTGSNTYAPRGHGLTAFCKPQTPFIIKFVPKEMDKHNNSVDDWIIFNTKQCKAIGAAPFYWETGGLLDRRNMVVLDQRSLDAIKF